jgi:tetratricopeptide (TPR) repeat protein
MPSRNVFRAALLLVLLAALASDSLCQDASTLGSARMLVAEGDHAEAMRLLRGVPDDSLSPQGTYLLGLCLQAALEHEDAIDVLQRADTSASLVRAAIGRSQELLGRLDDAEASFLAAYRADSSNLLVAMNLARLLSAAGRWKPVRDIYERLLHEQPDNPFIHAQLGTAYRALDSTEGAIVHLHTAHRLDPRNSRAALLLSSVYAGEEHFISARRVIERSLVELPMSPPLWQRAGEIAIKEEMYDRAIESFRNAIALGDSSALNRRNLGVSLYLGGQIDEAAEPLLLSHRADTTDGMTVFYLAMVRQFQEQWDAALTLFRLALQLLGQPLIADVHAQIATTYDRMDRDGDALQTYRLVQTLAPDKRETLFHLAALYDTHREDLKTALARYEDFLARVKDDELPQMQSWARHRVSEIRERLFFQEGRGATAGAEAIPSDSAEAPPSLITE